MSKLIGTSPNQVPSNADLGTAAFMDATDFLTSRGSSLSAVNAVIPKTAVDVFIYDTTKDSDGGAWRKRTKNTSWYNEPLNTTTRGNRREFPAVAVIILESAANGVEGETVDFTIYDGDNSDLPIWMQFRFILGSSVNTSITALNGKIIMGRGNNGILISDFVNDTLRIHNHVHRHTYSNISPSRLGRTAARSSKSESIVTGYNIINEAVNDVAMKVLPNAIIDTYSGLPIPTIAVATNGGLSIIKSGGNVVNVTASAGSSYNGVSFVEFSENNYLIFEQDSDTNSRSLYYIPVPESNTTTSTNDGDISDKVILKFYDNAAHVPYPSFNGGGVLKAIPMSGDSQAIRSNVGDGGAGYSETNMLTLLETNLADKEQGRAAYITADHNTGWMTGDNRLSTLSDTDASDISGTEILTNGDFSNGTTGWTIIDSNEGSISASSGQLTLNNTTATDPPVACYQAIDLEIGKHYTLESDHASGGVTVVNIVDTLTSGGGSGGYGNAVYHDVAGSKRRATFRATSQTNYVVIRVNTNAVTTVVMNSVSITEAEPGRGPYSRHLRDRMSGLKPIGTITKKPVAAGADLVSYSKFDTANYFTQHMHWTIGTGDFSFTFWVKPSASPGGYFHVVSIGTESTSGQNSASGIVLKLNNGDASPYFYNGQGGSQNTYDAANNIVPLTHWSQVVCGRKNGVFYIYINGRLTRTGNSSSYNISDNYLTIGHGIGMSETVPDTEIALVRISKTFPDADAIEKMYHDEKMLFQDNAKCTLYGTSDAAKAFAYDSSTKTLHVGTSDGRSDFQGLIRVNNTTRAVSTAISAVDGFIVEE